MTKPMLIEALKPGMRAKLLCGIVHHDESGFIKWEQTGDYCNHAALTCTDFEIVEEKPKPWEPKRPDYGWGIDMDFDVFQMESTISQKSLPTKQAAEHKAKLDRIITAIMCMFGAGKGNLACVYWGNPKFKAAKTPGYWVMEIPFDTFEHAEAAANYANELMEVSHDTA